MCGICGKISLNPNRPVHPEVIVRMARTLAHRGPEDEGVYTDQSEEPPFLSIGLGHRRLKIIDLSERAHQPFSNETGKIWVVFNGEIYNYRSLRSELIQKGHPFRSQSDTEVLVHLYEEEGIDFVNRLDGMFAFALWDEEKKLLLLARDPMGKKPLFYAEGDDGIIFASELKAILEDPDFKREVDRRAIDQYLSLYYIPAPLTIFKGVKKLLPGYVLIYESGKTTSRSYWSLNAERAGGLSEKKTKEKLLALLQEATRKRLESDVPLGVFLSGGIDSSAVVAMMRRISPKGTIRSFSIGFEESSYDERPFARLVAENFKTEHHEFLIRPDLLKVLPKMVWSLDEPFADASALPTFYLAQHTREAVTVALNGDGGDELFGGYERYVANVLSEWLRSTHLTFSVRTLSSLIATLFNGEADRANFSVRLKRFSESLGRSPEERYLDWVGLFRKDEREKLYTASFRESIESEGAFGYLKKCYDRFPEHPFSAATPLVDMVSYLPNDLLVKADRMTMAHALEGRSPFLDRDLVAFAASLPFSMKVRGLTQKYILKRALRPFLPKEIIKRKKQGFGVPVGLWFRRELRPMLKDTLLGDRFLDRGIFEREAVQRLIERHLSGKEDMGQCLFSLFILELWYRIFVDGEREGVSRSEEQMSLEVKR
ncbi:MAG: asparagine synthase (glutamine-hydrolyzing) [Candidatus Omnitrophica bacterium]|nr:asparagine synthase (glutamine-hydrolyzing) [Candidatus Omnitrophota bacterium]